MSYAQCGVEVAPLPVSYPFFLLPAAPSAPESAIVVYFRVSRFTNRPEQQKKPAQKSSTAALQFSLFHPYPFDH